jgi:hypothetical protein
LENMSGMCGHTCPAPAHMEYSHMIRRRLRNGT